MHLTTEPQNTWDKTDRTKGEIEKSTIIIRDFNILFKVIDRLWKQNIGKNITALISAIDQLDLIEFYRTLQPTMSESVFFSSSHGTFIKIGYIPSHRIDLKKLKK